jgi:triosephosphate isomerase (TIM)
MRQLIAGNWKMNGLRESAVKLASELADAAPSLSCDLVICPPFPLLYPLGLVLDGTDVALGAQDCHAAVSGAFTGDVAAPMVAETGARYVIVGHSERRQYHNETDAMVRAKAEAAIKAGLTPIICVGESETQRRAGEQIEVVGRQLAESVPDGYTGVVSYEPIWAIGTGLTPTLEDVAAMHGFIRAQLLARLGEAAVGMRLLYGGSVKPSNAAELLGVPNVNGALVGGASLTAAEFLGIARTAR